MRKNKLFQQFRIPRTGLQNNHTRLRKPLTHDPKSLPCMERIGPDSRVGRDSQKCPDRHPRQCNDFSTSQQLRQPLRGVRLLRRIRVVSIKEDIRVEDSHRCCSPSPYSTSDSTSSKFNPALYPIGNGSMLTMRRLCVSSRFSSADRNRSFSVSRNEAPLDLLSSFTRSSTSSSRVTVVRMLMMSSGYIYRIIPMGAHPEKSISQTISIT
jgi:hypothetical protein